MEKWDIDTVFLFYIAILLFCVPLRWLAAIMTAVIVHETCHAAAVYLCGAKIKKIMIGIHGISMETERLSPFRAVISILAGPTGSFSLILCSRFFPRLAICGFMHGAFNLLPVYPLDGGQLLKIFTEMKFQTDKAMRICHTVSDAACVIIFLVSIFAFFRFKAGICSLAAALWLLSQKIPCKDSKLRVQ